MIGASTPRPKFVEMRRIPFALSLVALALALFAVMRPADNVTASLVPIQQHPSEEVEVAVHMGRIQRYHQKWWAAGKVGNAELAAFYLHELEEAMEVIAQARLMEDGVDLSAHMNAYGVKTIEALEQVLKDQGVAAMHAESATLVNSCNGCHVATGHSFIRIQVPTAVDFPDQDFSPIGK